MAAPSDVRAEFDAFFESAYPWLASQLRAITGDAGTARWAVDEAFVRCWQSWASVRKLADPLAWVRWTALRVAAGTRRELSFRRRTPEPSAITGGSEEAVVLDALHRLPASQRRAIVLHYMGEVTVAELARRSSTTPAAVEWLLDTGFDSLVGLLTWPDEPGADPDDETFDPRYDWTAEALGDTATRLAADVTVPTPAAVLHRAAVLRWARRAVPVAVSAACVSGVVVLAAQLNPGGGDAGPRTPYAYSVAGPAPYEAAQPDGAEPVAGEPVAGPEAREVPLGTSIVSVARSTPLQDFGISAPAAPQAGGSPTAAAASGSPAAGSGGSAGGTTTPPGGAATPPAGGGSGTAPPASSAPGTVPPGTVPPTTVPPTSVPPTTVPPRTVPPTTVPTTTTTTPPTTTPTRPPTTAPTTEPTTTTAATTTAATTTTEAPATTTKAKPTPVEPTTTEAAETTTKPSPTTTPAADPTRDEAAIP